MFFQITTVGLDYNIRLKVELKSDDIIDPLTEVLNPFIFFIYSYQN